VNIIDSKTMTTDKSDDSNAEETRSELDGPSGSTEPEGKDILSPEELDISDSEYVEKLDDSGRYVVSPGGGPPNVPDSVSGEGSSGDDTGVGDRADPDPRSSAPSGREPASGPTASPEAARTLLADELRRSNARYGVDIVACFEGNSSRHRTVSDDVIATFENLVRWYAGHVTDGTPPDEVVEILLRESTFETDETPNLAKLLDAHDLDRTDSIADLVAAIREEAGD